MLICNWRASETLTGVTQLKIGDVYLFINPQRACAQRVTVVLVSLTLSAHAPEGI